MPKFGENSLYWTLNSVISGLEAILNDEEELQERRPTARRGKQIEKIWSAIDLLQQCVTD
jgi:hypothetical protein